MSDLQCAATLLVTPGAARARDLAGTLAGRRIARVYTSPQAGAVRTAEMVADLGADVVVCEGLCAPTEAEPGDEVVSRFGQILESVADLHRGETVLVVCDGRTLSVALPRLVSNLGRGFAAAAEGMLVEVAADADDWICVHEQAI